MTQCPHTCFCVMVDDPMSLWRCTGEGGVLSN